MRMAVTAVAVLAVALVLPGCSDSGDESHSADRASSAIDVSSTAPGTTVQEWASEIAAIKGDVEEAERGWGACSTAALSQGDTTCSAAVVVMAMAAQSAQDDVLELTDPNGIRYLGEPPVAIADLVEQTLQAVSDAADAYPAESGDGFATNAPAFVTQEWGRLVVVLANWEPYL